MQTPTSGERDAAVTPDIIALTRPDGNSSPGTDKGPFDDDIREKLLGAAGLLALERVEKEETERQYQDLLQSTNNSEQVRILTDLVEKRRLENRALIDENQKLEEKL